MTMQRFKESCLSPLVFIGSLLFLLWFIPSDRFAKIIGKRFPVSTELTVTSIEPYDYNGLDAMLITGYIDKLYIADPKGVKWYYSNNGSTVWVDSMFLDQPQIRGVGRQPFEGIIIGGTPEQLPKMYSYVEHDWHGIRILTKFYTGEDHDTD